MIVCTYACIFQQTLDWERQILYPRERHANDLSGKIDEMAGDIQYLMQAFTGLEDRLSKIEGSGADQGVDSKM